MQSAPLIPFIDARVPAGFPSPANDYLEKRIDLNEEFIKHPLSTFVFTCSGESMLNAFIPERACLLIDRSLTPKNGDIILASIQGEFTVKYFQKSDFHCRLLPANPKYQPIDVTEEMQMIVFGVVIKIIIDPKDIQYVRPC